MRRFITFWLIIIIAGFVHNSWETPSKSTKCCASDFNLKERNGTFECNNDVRKRLQISSERQNFLAENITGQCVEILNNDFFSFDVIEGKVTDKNNVTDEYYPKCCPLNSAYDEFHRSCVEKENENVTDFITIQFIKVGLPECKIILDKKFDDLTSMESVLKEKNQGDFCLDKNTRGEFVLRECYDGLEICKKKRCIKKCCRDGQSFVGGGKCMDTFLYGMELNFSSAIKKSEDLGVVIYNTKCKRVNLLGSGNRTDNLPANYYFSLEESGTFHKSYVNTCGSEDIPIEEFNSYCIEHVSESRKINDGFYFFFCLEDLPAVENKFVFTRWAKIVSCIFLILTIIVYFLVNEVKTIFGKILLNYCLATLFEMIILTHSQSQENLEPTETECKIRSYMIIFFANALFVWLNIMCLDIYWTFCSTANSVQDQRRKDLKKFLYYFAYGWGFSTFLTGLVLFFDLNRVLPKCLQPNVGVTRCFFESEKENYGAVIFYHLPHLLLQILDTVLFMKTIVYCLRIKKKINKINDTSKSERKKKFETDTQQLTLICKLSVIMGAFLIFEVISSFFEMSKINKFTEYLEVIMDNITCLQGLLIFIIFICKRKIYKDLRRKFNITKSSSTLSSTSTASTSNSSGSHDVSMDATAAPKEVIKSSTVIADSKIK